MKENPIDGMSDQELKRDFWRFVASEVEKGRRSGKAEVVRVVIDWLDPYVDELILQKNLAESVECSRLASLAIRRVKPLIQALALMINKN